jgi:error-prone DNA polymerase
MAAWKRRGGLEPYRIRIIEGMQQRGYETAFAEQVFEQIKGFGSYGFPESHAASFALLVYVSAWLKCHHPAAFTAALVNAQPMGFYSPSQLIQDLRRQGVEVRPVDVRHSDWDCTLERARDGRPALRLGFCQVRGLVRERIESLLAARAQAPFDSVQDLAERGGLNRGDQARLAESGALRGLAGHRFRARWEVAGIEQMPPLLAGSRIIDSPLQLKPPSVAENLFADYASTGLSLGPHPLRLLRDQLKRRRCLSTGAARALQHGTPTRVAGLVSLRQRPGTASGVTFVTLEDEDGMLNVIVWRDLATRQRRELLDSRLLVIDGVLEQAESVVHLIAHRLHDASALLGDLDTRSRDFH